MRIIVVGTGYVGLVTGTCFAEMGNRVTCVDIDEKKIEGLRHGVLPIYEPGLEEMVARNVEGERLDFETSLGNALAACAPDEVPVIFIAVGTPPGEDGSADLKYVLGVASEIGRHLNGYAVIVDKSTVPVGTADKVRAAIRTELAKRATDVPFDVASNPEFLKEGAAIDDFMRPDRVVVGTDSSRARDLLHDLYAPFMRNHDRLMFMGVKEAEMTKYAANAMLATKISFMNEVANLCDRMGVDVEQVRLGIGSDSRIGYHFIYPGCGYGGSCFPKDVKALVSMAKERGLAPWVLDAVEQRNEDQKHYLTRKLAAHYKDDLRGRRFAVWGLAFKPGTDDMREASSLVLIRDLVEAGALVQAYDPVAEETARREIPAEWLNDGRVRFAENQYDALRDADALVLVTEWKAFRSPDFHFVAKALKEKVVFDGRNQYEPAALRRLGFTYYGVGRAG